MIGVELDQDLLSQSFLPNFILRDLIFMVQEDFLKMASEKWDHCEPICHYDQYGQTVSREDRCWRALKCFSRDRL